MLRAAGRRACGALLLGHKGHGSRVSHHHQQQHPALSSRYTRYYCAPREIPSTTASSAAFPSHGFWSRSIAQIYLDMLSKRPILTKSVTASTIYFFADLTSQAISGCQCDDRQNVHWDVARTLRMVAAGFFLSGPTLHLWFNFASRCVPGRDLISTIKKMAMGQIIYGPTFTVVFFSLNAFAQGESFNEVVSRLKRDFIPTIKSGLMYWPVCDFITYRYVPVHLQPLVSNSFSFVWSVYFTYMACLKKVEVAS